MTAGEGTLAAADGVQLHWRRASPAGGAPRGVVLLVHGYAEHLGRYREFVVHLAGRNLATAGIDLRGQRCFGVEGLPHASWLLLDYGSVVVHIFHEDARGYYDLERLWMDAARIPVEDLARSGS